MGRFAILIFMALALILASMKNWKYFLGLLLIFSAGLLGLFYYNMRMIESQLAEQSADRAIEIVRVAVDDAKKALFIDAGFQLHFREAHGLVVNPRKLDTAEMATVDSDGLDGLWPSDAAPAREFIESQGRAGLTAETICGSPLVLLTWADEADALARAGAVEERDNVWKVTDPAALFTWAAEARPWSDLGLRGRDAPLTVVTPSPDKSPVGLALVKLLVNVFIDPSSTPDEAPAAALAALDSMENVEETAAGLFNQYIRQGAGAYPLIAAAEHQVVAFHADHPDYRDRLETEVRVIHFDPPVMIEHPFVALTDPGAAFRTALKDPGVQQALWERHGFRPAVAEIAPPPVLEPLGLPETLQPPRPDPSAGLLEAVLAGMVG